MNKVNSIGQTFSKVLSRVRSGSMERIKDRAFTANRIAKTAVGRSRHAAYLVKDRSISRLMALGEAEVLRLYGRRGVQFRSGGCLHLRSPVYLGGAGGEDPRNSAGLLAVRMHATEEMPCAQS